jgi:hypothetical protein
MQDISKSDERHNKLVLVFAALEKLVGRQWTRNQLSRLVADSVKHCPLKSRYKLKSRHTEEWILSSRGTGATYRRSKELRKKLVAFQVNGISP